MAGFFAEAGFSYRRMSVAELRFSQLQKKGTVHFVPLQSNWLFLDLRRFIMNAKKMFALVLTAIVSVCAVFAQGSYVVKSVKGNVKYEAEAGVKKAVKVGQVLSATTFIDVGLNSTLVLEMDGEEITVKAMTKGALDKVAVSSAKGLKKGGSVAGNVKGDSGTGKSVSTASSRASEAKEDVDWDE